MELAAASATANALRIGLTIAVQGRRPELEFYYQVHNDFGPTSRIPERKLSGFTAPETEYRRHDIYVSFFVANIGSRRAENVRLAVGDQFKRHAGRRWGEIFDHPIRQMAPGQMVYIFRLEQQDLYSDDKALQSTDLTLSAAYDGPPSFRNWLPMLWARMKKRSRFRTDFAFNAKNIATDLPPARYAGS